MQMPHVLQSVIHLRIGQGPPEPIRSRLSLPGSPLQDAFDEVGVRHRKALPGESRSELHVDVSSRQTSRRQTAESRLLFAAMHDRDDSRVGDEPPQRIEILDGERIDRRNTVGRRDLHQR